jgi:hypothetical protein
MVTALTLTLVGPPNPPAGTRLGVEVTWTNVGSMPVRVPSDWASHLTVDATFLPHPDDKPPTEVTLAAFQPMPATSVKWMTVAAGAKLSATTDLASLLPRRCTPGCMPGLYVIDATMEPRTWTGLESDQQQPLGDSRLQLVIPADIGVANADEVSARVTPKVEAGVVQAQLVVKNVGDKPIWLPTTWGYTCTSEWDTGSGRAGGGAGVGFGGQGTYGDETSRVRLAPGKSTKFALPCGDPPPAGAKDLQVHLTLAPLTRFWPKDRHPGECALEGEISVR